MTSIPKPPIPVPTAQRAGAVDDWENEGGLQAPPATAARTPSDISLLAPAQTGDGLAAMRARFLADFASASAERPLARRRPRVPR